MLPRIRQRVIIAIAAMCGALAWVSISGWLGASDSSDGLSLMTAKTGVVTAVTVTAIAGLPALGLGLVASAMGNPLSGVFAVAAGLCVLAARGGPIDGWIARSELPGDYTWLMVEVVIWHAGIVAMISVVQWLRSPVRAMWPALAYDDHLGVDIHLRFPQLKAWAAGLICGVCGFSLSWVAIRNTDSAQVIGMLMISFGIGGLAAGLAFPRVNPVVVLLSPAVAAVGAYAYTMVAYGSSHLFLSAWYAQELPGVALGLPIHYASAAVMGCAAGLGVAQGIEAAKFQAVSA